MAFADEIAKLANSPRTVIGLFDGVTNYYYGYSARRVSTDWILARLLSISNIEFSLGVEGIPKTTCNIKIADPDGELFALGIDTTWAITAYLTFPDLAINGGLSYAFVIDRAPAFDDGVLSLRCISQYVSNIGRLRLPTVTNDDVEGFSTLDEVEQLIGKIYPIYLGHHEQVGVEPLWDDGVNIYYPFAVSATDDANILQTADIEVFIKGGNGSEYIKVPQTWKYNLVFDDTVYEVITETITRTGQSTNWRLHILKMAIFATNRLQITTDDSIRVSFTTATPTGARQDSETKQGSTHVDIVKQLCDYYLSDSSEDNVGTAGYDSTNINNTRDVAEDYGLFASVKIDDARDGVSLINTIISGAGIGYWLDEDGKINANIFAETSYTVMQNGYASYFEVKDWLHCVSINRSDFSVLNETTVFNNQLIDTNAQNSGVQRTQTFSNTNLEKSSSFILAWLEMQRRRSSVTCRNFSIKTPLVLSETDPADFLNFTERWSGMDDDPIQVTKFGINLQDMSCDLTLRDISEWTDVAGHVLVDETTYEESLGGVTCDIGAGSGVIALSGDIAAADVGDIFEVYTSNNYYSAKITVAPNNPGSGWQMTVGANGVANETGITAYRITQTATDAGNLCDTDDEFTGGDPGNKMLFR